MHPKTSDGRFAVEFFGVSKFYGENIALDHIDLQVKEGEIFGLLGPNGAGKTTTLESIVGLRSASKGTIKTFGRDPVAKRNDIRKIVSIQPQKSELIGSATVLETLRLWRSFYSRTTDLDQIIHSLDLEEFKEEQIRKLSGGQRQRALIACSLVSGADLVVLDEPSTGLDPNAKNELWSVIKGLKSEGKTVLISTHSMEEAETLCDRVAIIDLGKLIACGKPSELIHEHIPETIVTFTVQDLMEREKLSELDFVSSVKSQENNNSIDFEVYTDDVDRLSDFIRSEGVTAKYLNSRPARMDDVFRLLTGRIYDRGGESEKSVTSP